ncbi:MAG: hypothetical protein H0X41_06885 [Chitinophagaceae bacterium]|nr:hypothetical protein [Chitinophagaceae bacterium]
MRTGKATGKSTGIYIAIALIACSTLAVEIIISRIFSVITYYYMAFAAISVAMLGMTAGAVTLFIKRSWFEPSRQYKSFAWLSIAYWLSVITIALSFCLIPVAFDNIFHRAISLLLMIFLSTLPFYFSGIIISAALSFLPLPANKVYASDLLGAATGCLLVIGGFAFFDAISLLIFCGIAGLAAFALFSYQHAGKPFMKSMVILTAITIGLALVNSFTGNALRPPFIKGRREKSSDFIYEQWNSYSRISVRKAVIEPPQYWGPSPLAPHNRRILQYNMSIDGDAGTVLRSFRDSTDINHLEFDLVNFAYFLQKPGNTCIIGAGAGKDIQAAIHFRQKTITGIDLNPIFTDLLQNTFRTTANVAGHSGVQIINDEARSYLSRSSDKYDIIQMSLIDTWASVGAGAFSLSENNLYTVEAWKVFLAHLSDSGIFTVSRWYNPDNLGEAGRLLSLAMESLRRIGKRKPLDHIALLTINNLSTLIVSNRVFDDASVSLIQKKAAALRYNLVIAPGQLPRDPKLITIVTAASSEELSRKLSSDELNYTAPTDENPYFFNMLKFGHMRYSSAWKNGGIMTGNLQATISLFILIGCLSVFALLVCLVPVMFKTKTNQKGSINHSAFPALACYFSFIGMAFMFTEIAVLQKVSVFLGHPVYALGVLLFTIILSTGTGSFLNERLKTLSAKTFYALSVATAATIVTENFLLRFIIDHLITESMPVKIIVSVVAIFPLGILLGQFFPSGMRIIKDRNARQVSWLWALNGVFGVLVSAVAVLISVYAGISYNFYLASLFYLSLILLIKRMTADQNQYRQKWI